MDKILESVNISDLSVFEAKQSQLSTAHLPNCSICILLPGFVT